MNTLMILITVAACLFAACCVYIVKLRIALHRDAVLVAQSEAHAAVKEGELSRIHLELGRLQRAESDLRQSEAFFRTIFESSHAGIVVIDGQNRQILDANPAAATIQGREVDDLLGNIVDETTLGGSPEEHRLPKDRQPLYDKETSLIHRDGTAIPVLRSAIPLHTAQDNLWLVVIRDIRDRKAAEEKIRESMRQLEKANEDLKRHKDQIVQSEKLASIGQLAAGVAHEINNPVGFVTSNLGTLGEYAETMKKLLDLYGRWAADPTGEGSEALSAEISEIIEEEDLEFILEDLETVMSESQHGVERVAEIVQNLKSFAREDSLEKRDHDVNEGVEAMIKMVWNELKYTCEVVRELGEVPTIRCHAGQVNQVIMNMLVNASHAMGEDGGTITVSTAVVEDDVEIRIADQGSGIPADTLTKIFDPFFTTKDVGKGTGLGLAISHGIIQDHGGRIEVDSVLDEGTTFRIYLPLAATTVGVIS